MKKIYLFLVLAIAGCQEIGEPEPVPNETMIRIEKASAEYAGIFEEWLGQEGENARIVREFSPENLVLVSNGEYNRWAVPSNKDPNTVLSFVFDASNNISKTFISTTVKNPDNSITSRYYTPENKLMLETIHDPGGSVRVINRGITNPYGWWGEFEYCVGKVSAPFPSHVANLVAGVVFSAVTYGTWPGAVLLVCAGVATGRNYQN